MSRIYPLTAELINHIAAGEVIERPASVLKELLENALDAGAKNIKIAIGNGGLTEITVTDDGYGIHSDDLTLAITNHATSKIKNVPDLNEIQSLGFRGEALASISQIAKTHIVSKRIDIAQAMALQNYPKLKIMPAAHPVGTTVRIMELFYNTPARRKFLKSPRTEWLATQEIVVRMALSHFDCGFSLHHDDKLIWQLTPAQTDTEKLQRIKKLLGAAITQTLTHFEIQHENLGLSGWISAPNFSRSQTDMQYCFINQRFVRDRILQHAIKQLYSDQLPPGRHAVYILNLTLPPSDLDVNVHPAKIEVRFVEPRLIHDFVTFTLKNVFLGENNTIAAFKSTSVPVTMQYASQPTAVNLLQMGAYVLIQTDQLQLIYLNQALQAWLQAIQTKTLVAEIKPFIMPLIIPVPKTEIDLSKFHALGMDIESFGPQQLIIRAMPEFLNFIEINEFIETQKIQIKAELEIEALQKFIHVVKSLPNAKNYIKTVSSDELFSAWFKV